MAATVVIYDLEYTTWVGAMEREWAGENECRELTRIGAIKADSDTLEEKASFDCIIKPTIHEKVSDYFIELTGLSNDRLSQEGIDFFSGVKSFFDFVDSAPAVSFGKDALVFLENFELKGFQYKAERLSDGYEIRVKVNNLEQDSDTDLKPDVIDCHMYGPDVRIAEHQTIAGISIIHLSNKGTESILRYPFLSFDIRPWFHKHAPETRHKKSGELAETFGQSIKTGTIHEPLYDIRSILAGVKELIHQRAVGNIFKYPCFVFNAN